jgi:hypothetical protein
LPLILSPRYRWHNAHLISVFELRGQALEETYILPINVDIDKATQIAALVAKAFLKARKPGIEIVYTIAEVTTCQIDCRLTIAEPAKGCWNPDCNAHSFSPFYIGAEIAD